LTPYRADALTLTTSVPSSQFSVLSKTSADNVRADNCALTYCHPLQISKPALPNREQNVAHVRALTEN